MRSEKTTAFKLSDQQLTAIEAGLQELAYRVAAPIIADLQRQYQEANAAPVPEVKLPQAGSKRAPKLAGGPGPVKPPK